MKNIRQSKIKQDFINLEEEETNTIVFAAAEIISIMAFVAVVVFLDGSIRDWFVLLCSILGFGLRFWERRAIWFRKYAKYMYLMVSFWCTCVLVISNDGKYAAATQVYFIFLTIAIAYYDVKMVLYYSAVTIVSTVGALILFPEAMLKVDNLSIWIFILAVFVIGTFFAAIIAMRMRLLIEKTKQIKAYEDELVYLKQLEKKEEKHNEFIHNINHYFMAIGELARVENCDQIVNLVEELNGKMLQNERIIYANHKVLNAILSEKVNEASEQNIQVDIYVEPVIRMEGIADGDLVVMLGNLLDNAIEAAGQCEGDERKIVIRIYMENEGKVCVVKIVNYFTGSRIRKGSRFISTKKNREMQGIGIKSIKNTVKNYGGHLQCILEDKRFSSILILPIRK